MISWPIGMPYTTSAYWTLPIRMGRKKEAERDRNIQRDRERESERERDRQR